MTNVHYNMKELSKSNVFFKLFIYFVHSQNWLNNNYIHENILTKDHNIIQKFHQLLSIFLKLF